jgi:putative transposase
MYSIVTKLTNASTAENCIRQRARAIRLAFQGRQNVQIAEAIELERHSVGRWRKRWQDSFEALLAIEMNEPKAALERAIRDVLRDAHRSGAPSKFTAEQIVQLVSIACESPRDSGRPVDDWT